MSESEIKVHEKKEKGDRAVAHVIARLTDLGWRVGTLITEHAPYDLFAERGGIVHTVQVRHAPLRDGAVAISLRNSWADRAGTHVRVRQIGDYSLLAAYCPNTSEVYFVRGSEYRNQSGLYLRVQPSKNNQKARVRVARDFLTP